MIVPLSPEEDEELRQQLEAEKYAATGAALPDNEYITTLRSLVRDVNVRYCPDPRAVKAAEQFTRGLLTTDELIQTLIEIKATGGQ